MPKVIDVISIAMLLAAAGAFTLGIRALADRQDLVSLYWLVVGALVLRASTDMLRPKPGSR
jgi:hypothetical protein